MAWATISRPGSGLCMSYWRPGRNDPSTATDYAPGPVHRPVPEQRPSLAGTLTATQPNLLLGRHV